MHVVLRATGLAIFAFAAAATPPVLRQATALDQALAAYWVAGGPAEAAVAAEEVLRSGAGFQQIYDRLAQGPEFDAEAPTGRLLHSRTNRDGVEHPYLVMVPESYDPRRRYPVRVYLHGGVGRPGGRDDGAWWRNPERLAADDLISVFPYSWRDSLWWEASQVENLAEILWLLKRSYNVDDDNVFLFGVSDGGTGAWFFAFRESTPWAGFLPFIAHPAVLSNPGTGVGGQLFPINLRAKPFYVVNGGQDRLYPSASVEPYMTLFRDAGAEVTFVDKPDEAHSTRWWPEEAAEIEAFIAAHPRDPLPDRLAWRADSAARANRAHWIVVDEIRADDRELFEPNAVVVGGRSYLAFPRHDISGQIEVVRRGNEVEVATWGIARYTLLLAPTEFDFERPVVVRTNGVASFSGRLQPSPDVLLRWNARDADRSMLFAQELTIEVEPAPLPVSDRPAPGDESNRPGGR